MTKILRSISLIFRDYLLDEKFLKIATYLSHFDTNSNHSPFLWRFSSPLFPSPIIPLFSGYFPSYFSLFTTPQQKKKCKLFDSIRCDWILVKIFQFCRKFSYIFWTNLNLWITQFWNFRIVVSMQQNGRIEHRGNFPLF